MIKTFNSLLVTMFGLGKIKFMPGTFGSLATAIFLFYLFHTLNISSKIILRNSDDRASAPSSSTRMRWTVLPCLLIMQINQRTIDTGDRLDLVGKAHG